MCLLVAFCTVVFCRILLQIGPCLSLGVGDIASGSGCARLVCHLSHTGSSSSLDVWGFLLGMESCTLMLRPLIFERVFGSVSWAEGVGSCCTAVVGSSFCSLRHGNPLVHPAMIGINLGPVPVVRRGLESLACGRRFVPFSSAALGGSCAGRLLALCFC